MKKIPPAKSKVSYLLQTRRCSKVGCAGCPHGPYWYAYWREGGKLHSAYVGKERPDEQGRSDAR